MKLAFLLSGIVAFALFATFIEYHKGMWTWFWLLISQLNFLLYLEDAIKELLKKKE